MATLKKPELKARLTFSWLSQACASGSLAHIQYALKLGAPIRIQLKDKPLKTCLSAIKLTNQAEAEKLIRYLLAQGVGDDINLFDQKNQHSPFTAAISQGALNIVELYSKHGAKMNLATPEGRYPLNIALKNIEDLDKRQAMIAFLVDNGTSIDEAMVFAIRHKEIAQVKQLAAAGGSLESALETMDGEVSLTMQAELDAISDKKSSKPS